MILGMLVALAAGAVLAIAAADHQTSLETGSDSPNFIAVAREPVR